jgi:hypothetical protein
VIAMFCCCLRCGFCLLLAPQAGRTHREAMYKCAYCWCFASLCAQILGCSLLLACALFIQAGFAISSMQFQQRRILLLVRNIKRGKNP